MKLFLLFVFHPEIATIWQYKSPSICNLSRVHKNLWKWAMFCSSSFPKYTENKTKLLLSKQCCALLNVYILWAGTENSTFMLDKMLFLAHFRRPENIALLFGSRSMSYTLMRTLESGIAASCAFLFSPVNKQWFVSICVWKNNIYSAALRASFCLLLNSDLRDFHWF